MLAARLNWVTDNAAALTPSLSLTADDLFGTGSTNMMGTLFLDPTAKTATFQASNNFNSFASFLLSGNFTQSVLLPDGDYHVTLRSGALAFRDVFGNGLAGDGTNPGTSYVATHTISPAQYATPTVYLPQFAQGPTQAVNVASDSELYNQTFTGLPLMITDGAHVTSGSVTLHFDPGLLHIDSGPLTSGLDPVDGLPLVTGTVLVDNTLGIAVIEWQSTAQKSGGLPAFADIGGSVTIGTLSATVQNTYFSRYGDKELLHLTDLTLNTGGGAIAGQTSDGIHVNVFRGDANGSGSYSAADANLAANVAVGNDTGYDVYRLIDPNLITNNRGLVDPLGSYPTNAADVSALFYAAAGEFGPTTTFGDLEPIPVEFLGEVPVFGEML